MTTTAQRIAIAEKCGWKRCRIPTQGRDDPLPRGWALNGNGGWGARDRLPNYLNDLNAMHEAEKVLDAFQWELYREELAESCTPLSQCRSKEQQYKFAMHATAAQRAEAFLKAANLWSDK